MASKKPLTRLPMWLEEAGESNTDDFKCTLCFVFGGKWFE